MSYQFTEFRRGQFDAYLRFLSRLRPREGAGPGAPGGPGAPMAPTAADLRHRWRTFENPWDGYFLAAHTDEELAATLTLSARRLRTPAGEVLPCFELGDGWTSDRHRKRGLFFALGARARERVFSGTDAGLIIGAPNPSAEPNWRKHGYLFSRDDGTRLVLLPALSQVARHRLRGWWASRQQEGERARRAEAAFGGASGPAPLWDGASAEGPGGAGGPLAAGGVSARGAGSAAALPALALSALSGAELRELAFEDYAARTARLPRMNDAGGGYLRWRFRASPDGYRYFRVAPGARRGPLSPGGELLCALRVTHLGDLPVLVVSECFLDGRVAPRGRRDGAVLGWLRALGARCYRGHGGVYVNAAAEGSPEGRLRLLARGGVTHRPQPLIFLFKDGRDAAKEALVDALRRDFQLSDCDVG